MSRAGIVDDVGTLITVVLVVAIVLAIVAIVQAVRHAPYTNWLIGAVIAFVLWIVLTFVVH